MKEFKDYILHGLWGLLTVVAGFLLYSTSDKLGKIESDLSTFKYTVAADYATKSSMNRIESKLDHISELILGLHKREN